MYLQLIHLLLLAVGLIDSIILHSLSVLASLILTGIMVSERGWGIDSLVVSLLWTSSTESPVILFLESGLLDRNTENFHLLPQLSP